MPIAEWIAAIQTNPPSAESGSSNSAWIWLIVLIAAVMGLIAVIFIRSSARRSSKSE